MAPPVPPEMKILRHPLPRQAPPPSSEPPPLHSPPALPRQWQNDLELDAQAPVIGVGAFAQVLRAKDRSSGQIWAIKVLSRPAFACRGIEGQIWNELSALRRCAEEPQGRGRRVVQLLDAVEESGMVYLRLALCSCDIQQVLDARGRIEEVETCYYAAQLMAGIQDLHSLNILHRDIKPSNLLLDAGDLRITDFGWCCTLSENPRSLAGTFQYMAPEVLKQELQTTAVDLWSAGVTLLQILTGRHLVSSPGSSGLSHVDPQKGTALKVAALLAEIERYCPFGDESRPSYLSQVCWGFLRQLVEPSAQRATAATALAHAWLRGHPAVMRHKAPGDAEAKVPTPPRASPRGGVSATAAEQRRHAHEQIVLDPFESRASQSSQRLTPRGPYPSPEGAEPHGVFRSRSATVSSSTGSDDLPSTKVLFAQMSEVATENQDGELARMPGPALQDWVLKMTRLLREIQEKARGIREVSAHEERRCKRNARHSLP